MGRGARWRRANNMSGKTQRITSPAGTQKDLSWPAMTDLRLRLSVEIEGCASIVSKEISIYLFLG